MKVDINKEKDLNYRYLLHAESREVKFAEYVKMTIAKDLYKNRNVSLEHCAAIANMSEQAFAKCLEEKEVSE